MEGSISAFFTLKTNTVNDWRSLIIPLSLQQTNVAQWKIVFWGEAGILTTICIFYTFLASADVQPWNDPDYSQNKKKSKWLFGYTGTQLLNCFHRVKRSIDQRFLFILVLTDVMNIQEDYCDENLEDGLRLEEKALKLEKTSVDW